MKTPLTPPMETPAPIPGAAIPAAVPPVATPAPVAAPAYAGGGQPSGNFFSGLNTTEVLLLGLASATLFCMIFYYRGRIKYIKKEQSEMKDQLDEVKTNVKTAMGEQYQSFV